MIHRNKLKTIENPIIIKEGKKVAVLFYGSVGIEVIKATQDLKICPLVISVPKLQPLNFTFLFKVLKDIQTLITVEEHFVEGGLGSIIADWLSREKLPFKLKKLGIKNEFIHAIKNNAGMRQYYRISADQIKDTIREAFSHG